LWSTSLGKGTRLLDSGIVRLMINQSVWSWSEGYTRCSELFSAVLLSKVIPYTIALCLISICLLILHLSVAICEIWLFYFTYNVYLVLSLKLGVTDIYVRSRELSRMTGKVCDSTCMTEKVCDSTHMTGKDRENTRMIG
jgi:Ca2+/Na+ antiporter